MSSGGARVSIPNSVRKTIQNIKEITGNHSEDDIYAMLKECSMDPNETTQKLLLQDTFHEVKRKRDRRKEHVNNKESTEPRWRPGMQVRGNKAGQGNYSSRYLSHDAGGGRTSAPGKENGSNPVTEKGVSLSSLPISQDKKNKEATAASAVIAGDPPAVASGSSSAVVGLAEEGSDVGISKLGGQPPLLPQVDAKDKPITGFGANGTHGQLTPNSSDSSASMTPALSSGVFFSTSDAVLAPSFDSRLPSNVGTIKREVGSQCTPGEQIGPIHADSEATAASEFESSMQGKMPSKFQSTTKNQISECVKLAPSSDGSSFAISGYNGRSQQVNGTQKGLSKEWKPKLNNTNLGQGSETAGSSEVSTTVEANANLHPLLSDVDVEESTLELQKKIEGSHISDGQHVVIPNHLIVPEAKKVGFCFGSFGATFDLSTSNNNDSVSDKSLTPIAGTSDGVEDPLDPHSSNQNALKSGEEGEFAHHPQSPAQAPDVSSGECDVPSNAIPEFSESKQENSLPPGTNQYLMVQTSPNSFGFIPPVLNPPLTPFESSESQARDVARLPSFVVPQPFDPASYYPQFYRPSADSDGRISPFHAPVVSKYNGNIPVISPQTSQSPQEGGNSLSAAGPTPLVTQAAAAAGVMSGSVPVTQQSLPIFRQPTGVHLSPYPPSYFPYGHYFSPYYLPPPAIHQILSNGAFPQQPQAGSMYPAAPPTASAKYSSLPQYKPGTNTGNSAHYGVVPGNYTPYGSSPSGYTPSSASTAGNSTANEDLASSQLKENNSVYISGQQNEGSAVWMGAPQGREISGMAASSFYNIPQGTYTQAGMYHHHHHPAQGGVASATTAHHPHLQQSQTMPGAGGGGGGIDAVGPASNVYQQQQQQTQHSQMNWPNNY